MVRPCGALALLLSGCTLLAPFDAVPPPDGAADGDADTDIDGDVDGGDGGTDADEGDSIGGDACDPDCGGRECGSDGCGGSCGGCDDGYTCLELEGSCNVGEWVHISAGTFTMGSPEGELGRSTTRDETEHEVTLTHDFIMLASEVQQGQFHALLHYDPSYFSEPGPGAPCYPDCPVESVSWHEAAAACNAFSDMSGLARCYSCSALPPEDPSFTCDHSWAFASPYECPGYRLPTEAEWEYAARAGITSATYNGPLDVTGCAPSPVLDPIAWYCGNACVGRCEPEGAPESDPLGTTYPSMSKEPNAWGLYGMLGNVMEWCADWYQALYPGEPVIDPFGATRNAGRTRACRGEGWQGAAETMRAAARFELSPNSSARHLGFRMVRTVSGLDP